MFAHFIIADITFELKNFTFAKIVPRTFYLLYGMQFAFAITEVHTTYDTEGKKMHLGNFVDFY